MNDLANRTGLIHRDTMPEPHISGISLKSPYFQLKRVHSSTPWDLT
jgi:hypothetical protein